MLIRWIKKMLAQRHQRREFEAFRQRWQCRFTGSMFQIGRDRVGIVNEYAYLLRYYSSGRVDSFENFEAIESSMPDVVARIQADLQSPTPRESQVFTGVTTAKLNLKHLLVALDCVTDYLRVARAAGLPLSPLHA